MYIVNWRDVEPAQVWRQSLPELPVISGASRAPTSLRDSDESRVAVVDVVRHLNVWQ